MGRSFTSTSIAVTGWYKVSANPATDVEYFRANNVDADLGTNCRLPLILRQNTMYTFAHGMGANSNALQTHAVTGADVVNNWVLLIASGCSNQSSRMCHSLVGGSVSCSTTPRTGVFHYWDPLNAYARIAVGGKFANGPTGDVKDVRYYLT